MNGGNPEINNGVPSAEIDAPIQLSASQTWEVDPGQFLMVKGALTEVGGTAQDTLTKTGTGTALSQGRRRVDRRDECQRRPGHSRRGRFDRRDCARSRLNGGGVIFSVNGTPANTTLTVGSPTAAELGPTPASAS